MTNQYSTLKNNLSSEKRLYLRMNPARSIIDDMVLDSGFTYKITFPFEAVNTIKVDGSTFTKVTTLTSSGQWTFDETTREIKVRLASAISNYQNIVAYYYLFYTNALAKYNYEDPENSATTIRFWDSRLSILPSFNSTSEDIVDGFITIGNSSLSLKNYDKDFQKYLTIDDSFSRKEVKIWHCLDNNENIAKFFFGYISNVRLGNFEVSISIDNQFQKFNNILYSSNTFGESYFTTSKFPNMDKKDLFKPIPKHYSYRSKTVDFYFTEGQTNNLGAYTPFYSATEGFEAVNVNFSETRSKTTNRQWACCIKNTTSGAHSETAGTVTNPLSSYYIISVADTDKYEINDNVRVNGGSFYTNVTAKLPGKIVVFQPFIPVPVSGCLVERPEISMLQTFDDAGKPMFLKYGTHYTEATYDTNTRGVVLTNDFENDFPTATLSANSLSPSARIIYRIYNNDALDHGSVISDLITIAGLSVDSATITAANATNIKTNFSIPFYQENEFGKISEYLQSILTSTLGYLLINDNFEIGYKLIDTVSAADSISKNDIMQGTFSQIIDYKDIFTSIDFNNKHGSKTFQVTGISWSLTTYDSEELDRITNDRALYLHEVENKRKIECVIQSVQNTKDRIQKVFGVPRLNFDLSTKGINFTSNIGDQYNIDSDEVAGGTATRSGVILGITKSNAQTNISLTNFDTL